MKTGENKAKTHFGYDHIKSNPGVYLFKDASGEIVYIGKAKNLKKRVASYFATSYFATSCFATSCFSRGEAKARSIVEASAQVEQIVTGNELEAIFLEAHLIRKHQPKFNVLLKFGEPYLFILFSTTNISITRVAGGAGEYFGPFLDRGATRKVYNFLVTTFCLRVCNKKIENGCFYYHLGKCAGSCRSDFDKNGYLNRLELAKRSLKQGHKKFLKYLEEQIQENNKKLRFEKSQEFYRYHQAFTKIFSSIKAERSVTAKKRLKKFHCKTIDCFDISHKQGFHIVGASVRFKDGKPDKSNFRHFKIKTLDGQNDYAALQEIVGRRYKNESDIPDLVLIDGGKGQLNAVKKILTNAQIASIAKREETFFSQEFPAGRKLDIHDRDDALLIEIRDYAHHFAISYHRKLAQSL